MPVTQNTILITGASTGIGRACALEFARRGWLVFAGVRRAADADGLRAENSTTVPLLFDVTEGAQIAAAMEQIRAQAGGLNALINNAGISVPAPLEILPLEEFRRQFEVNVTGVLAVTQAALPLLRAAEGRRTILMISSGSARLAMPVTGAYAASKFALEAMTDALRVELAPWQIRVVSLQPGPVVSAIWETTMARSERMLATIPPEKVAPYRPLIDFARRYAVERRMLPAERIARVAWRIVTARRPPARVYITPNRWLHLLLEALPVRWRDGLMLRLLPAWGDVNPD